MRSDDLIKEVIIFTLREKIHDFGNKGMHICKTGGKRVVEVSCSSGTCSVGTPMKR